MAISLFMVIGVAGSVVIGPGAPQRYSPELLSPRMALPGAGLQTGEAIIMSNFAEMVSIHGEGR